MNGQESARVLLRLGAAFRADISEDQVLVWHNQIARFEYAVAQEAADHLTRTADRFPTVGQFISACQEVMRAESRERRAQQRGDRPFDTRVRADGTVRCVECGDSDVVEVDDPRGGVVVRPCSQCDPAMYERWADGHLDSGHDRYSCRDEDCREHRSAHAQPFRHVSEGRDQARADRLRRVRESLPAQPERTDHA